MTNDVLIRTAAVEPDTELELREPTIIAPPDLVPRPSRPSGVRRRGPDRRPWIIRRAGSVMLSALILGSATGTLLAYVDSLEPAVRLDRTTAPTTAPTTATSIPVVGPDRSVGASSHMDASTDPPVRRAAPTPADGAAGDGSTSVTTVASVPAVVTGVTPTTAATVPPTTVPAPTTTAPEETTPPSTNPAPSGPPITAPPPTVPGA